MVQAWHLLLSAGLVITILTRPAEASEPAAGYVGSAQCGTCHKPEHQKQSNSHHAQALTPILQSSVAAKLIGRTVREKSGVAFEYSEVPNGIAVTAKLGDAHSSAVLRWAFGAGVRGITPVGLLDGKYFEHRVSWYSEQDRAGLTMGHSTAPTSAHAALGLPQSQDVIYRCFNCHATAVKAGPDLSDMRPGIECERCHGAGLAHVKQPSVKTISNPGRLSPRALAENCGQCHRAPSSTNSVTRSETDDPQSVRFAPIGLMASQCFRRSGTLSCLTCHNPHENVAQNASHYVEKCVACHGAPLEQTNAACRRGTRENCLPCHMPKAQIAPFLAFTDHRIRVISVSQDSAWERVERALAASDYEGAQKLLQSLPSGSAKWHLLASRAYDGLKDPARAVSEAQQAISMDPANLSAFLQLGQVFLEHNTPVAAAEIFGKALEIKPNSLLAHLGRGLALKGIQQFDAAEKELSWCLERDPRSAVAFDSLATLYLEAQDYEKVATAARKYIGSNPSDYRGYYYLATSKEHDNTDLHSAEDLLRTALRLNAAFAASHALLGKVLVSLGRAEEAIGPLQRAAQLRPDYIPAHLSLVNAYTKLGRKSDARRELQTIRELNDKQTSQPGLLYHRGTEASK